MYQQKKPLAKYMFIIRAETVCLQTVANLTKNKQNISVCLQTVAHLTKKKQNIRKNRLYKDINKY